MLSNLELRHLIESAFLPLSCKCEADPVDPVGSLQAQIIDPASGRVELLITGISVTNLNGNQAITKLIAELRDELHTTHEVSSTRRFR